MRKVWVRNPNSSSLGEWIPAVVPPNSSRNAEKIQVQLTSWEGLLQKKKRSSSDSSESESEPDSDVDEETLHDVAVSDIVDRNEWNSPPEDLVQLVHLHEPAILQALCERFWDSHIYTWCGPILLALNPFERLPLYKNSILETYKSNETKAPHVYAVAADAYSCLIDKSGRDASSQDQSILISGESGAGKTESTKIVMQYLATVATHGDAPKRLHVSEYLGGDDVEEEPAPTTGDGEETTTIEQQVLESNPILEAFGNARTIRNDNSSRFGKFIQIQFDQNGFLVGAAIATYLLEKVRIIQQGEGERGYHIFYQMLFGGSAEEKEAWHIPVDADPMDFFFTNSGDCVDRRDGVNDADQLQVTKNAMDIMGINKEDQDAVLTLVAAVLHFGNLEFVNTAKEGESTISASTPSLNALTVLLGLDSAEIIKALCTRNVSAGGETFEKPLAPELAADTRDALAKSVYSRAFDWLVMKINECIKHQSKMKRFIGVLDIFGFEIFKHNSFEQLCINYANERLQQQFNDFVFKHEQTIYAKEKIKWSFIDFPSNSTTVELIDGTSTSEMGVLALLDDECRLPKGTDSGYVRKLYDACENRDRFAASKAQKVRCEFVIEHYAGEVVYNTEGFCDKNRDALRQEAVDLMSKAGNKFIRQLFDETKPSKKAVKRRQSSGGNNRRSALSLSSVGAQFKSQLSSLLETISKTAPHYIRCIKPNDQAKAKVVTRAMVVSQLKCGGVLEAVRVARAGFPIRMPHGIFIQRYGRIAGPAALRYLFSCSVKSSPSALAKSQKLLKILPQIGSLDRSTSRSYANDLLDLIAANDGEVVVRDISQVGKTKVFLRKQGHDLFERWVSDWRSRSASIIFARLYGAHLEKKYRAIRNAVVTIQAVLRGKRDRVKAHSIRMDRATLRLQCWIRSKFFSIAYTTIRRAICTIQRYRRGQVGRNSARERRICKARLRLQSFIRGYRYRREFLDKRSATITLQCLVRVSQAQKHTKERKRQCNDLQYVVSERDELKALVRTLKQQLSDGGGNGGTVPPQQVETSGSLDKKKAWLIGLGALVSFRMIPILLQYKKQPTISNEQPTMAKEHRISSTAAVALNDIVHHQQDEWYKSIFGEELEHLGKCSTPPPKKPQEQQQQPEKTQSFQEMERELELKRQSIEAKRLELQELQSKLDEQQLLQVPTSSSSNDDHAVALQLLLEEKSQENQNLVATNASMSKELEDLKQHIGRLTGLKNQSEVKQGELELSLSSVQQHNQSLQDTITELTSAKETLQERIESLEDELERNEDVLKCAAVLELEKQITSLQNQNASFQDTIQRKKPLEEKYNQTKKILEDYRESTIAKTKHLEDEIEKLQVAKRKNDNRLKARVLIDRRSRRTAQQVLGQWAKLARQNAQDVRIALVTQSLFQKRRLKAVFFAWSKYTKATKHNERVLDQYLHRKNAATVRRTFVAWREQTRRHFYVENVLSHKIEADKNNMILKKVVSSWRMYAVLNAEERILFKKLRLAFDKQKRQRVFSSWRKVVHFEVRAPIVVDVIQTKRNRVLLCKVFYSWKNHRQGTKGDTTVEEEQKGDSKQNIELVATLMKRMEMQDEKIESLLQEKQDSATSPSPYRARIEQLSSDEEDADNDNHQQNSIPDSFYNPSPVVSWYSKRKTKSARFTVESMSPPSDMSSTSMSSSNSNASPPDAMQRQTKTLSPAEIFKSPRKSSFTENSERLTRTNFTPPFHAMARTQSTPMFLIQDEDVLDPIVNAVDEKDGTLIFKRTSEEDEEKTMIDLETVLQTADTISVPPLVLAAQHGLVEVVKNLLLKSFDPNLEDYQKGRTPLQAAIEAHKWSGDGSERMVELLLENGADVHRKNKQGNSPLMAAVCKGDNALSLVKALLRHGALQQERNGLGTTEEGENDYGQTPLHAAVRVGAVNIMHMLLKHGASLNRGDSQGQTALHHAARVCDVMMMQNLIGFGVASSISVVDQVDINGNTALHLVCSSTSPVDLARAIFILLENDFNPNLKNKAGQTPLHILCSNNRASREALLKFRSPPVRFYEQDRNGNTPLHVACHLNEREIACTLVELGAEVYIPNNENMTALNLVPQAFAVKLLSSIRRKPDEALTQRIHRGVVSCMLCNTKFGRFFDQHTCRHCGRACCSKCGDKKYPVIKFGIETSEIVCSHCFAVLTMSADLVGSPSSLEDDGVVMGFNDSSPSTGF